MFYVPFVTGILLISAKREIVKQYFLLQQRAYKNEAQGATGKRQIHTFTSKYSISPVRQISVSFSTKDQNILTP